MKCSRVLKNHRDISLGGALEFSAATAARSSESTCDVLLVDPANSDAFDSHLLYKPNGRFSKKTLTIDMEARITEVIS